MVSLSSRRRTLSRPDVAQAIAKSDMFDFLIDIVPRDDATTTTTAATAGPSAASTSAAHTPAATTTTAGDTPRSRQVPPKRRTRGRRTRQVPGEEDDEGYDDEEGEGEGEEEGEAEEDGVARKRQRTGTDDGGGEDSAGTYEPPVNTLGWPNSGYEYTQVSLPLIDVATGARADCEPPLLSRQTDGFYEQPADAQR